MINPTTTMMTLMTSQGWSPGSYVTPRSVLRFLVISAGLVLLLGGYSPTMAASDRTRSLRRGGRSRRQWREGDIRLVGGANRTSGTILLYHQGKWGAVCDDSWDVSSSDVVCRQQGFSGSARLALSKEFGGRAKRRIWIAGVQCQGHEQRLLNCSYEGWGYRIRHKCPGTWRSAGVVCRAKPPQKKKTPAERRAWRLKNRKKWLARRKALAAKRQKAAEAREARRRKLKKLKEPSARPGAGSGIEVEKVKDPPSPQGQRAGAEAVADKDDLRRRPGDLHRLPEDGGGVRLEDVSSQDSEVLVPWAMVESHSELEDSARRRETAAGRQEDRHSEGDSLAGRSAKVTASGNATETSTSSAATTTTTTTAAATTTSASTTPTTTISSTTTTTTTTSTTTTTTTPETTTTTTPSTTTTTTTTTTTPTTTTTMPTTTSTSTPSLTTTTTTISITASTSTLPTSASFTSPVPTSTAPTSSLPSTVTAPSETSSIIASLSESPVTKEETNTEISTAPSQEREEPVVDLSSAKKAGEIALKDKGLGSQDDQDALLLQADSPSNPDLELQVVGGRYPWEGLLEVRKKTEEGAKEDPGPWGTICSDSWGMREVIVVCRELGLNYAKQPLTTNYFGGADKEKLYYSFNCTGREEKLSHCPAVHTSPDHTCSKQTSVAGIVCATYLPDLIPNLRALSDSLRLQDRALYYLQCALEENCLASSAYHIRNTSKAWRNNMRRLLRFSTIVHNRGDADFRPYVAKGQWEWHACHMHYHSMEVFAHYDIMDDNGTRLAEGSKASFCLEDTTCDKGVRRKFQCVGFGDQGLSVNCSDNYLWDIDCQWIDITDIKPGTYTFLMEINPSMLVAELDFDNNVARCDLWYSGYFAKLINCRHESLLDYRR